MELETISEIQEPRPIEGFLSNRMKGIATTPDRSLLACWVQGRSHPGRSETHEASADRLYLIDLNTVRVIRELKGGSWRMGDIAFNKDGSILASCGSLGDFHEKNVGGLIEVWKVGTGERLSSFTGFTTKVKRIAFSPTENALFYATARSEPGSRHGKRIPPSGVAVLDLDTEKTTALPLSAIDPSHELHHVVFSMTGDKIAASSGHPTLQLEGGNISVWKIARNRFTRRLRPEMIRRWSSQRITSIDFHPSRAELASISKTNKGSNICINLWDITTGERKEIYRGKNTFIEIYSLRYHPNGGILAISGEPSDFRDDSGVWIFDVTTGELYPLPNSRSHHIVFSENGKRLLNIRLSTIAVFGDFPGILE
jgi:WD40 repeat protein